MSIEQLEQVAAEMEVVEISAAEAHQRCSESSGLTAQDDEAIALALSDVDPENFRLGEEE